MADFATVLQHLDELNTVVTGMPATIDEVAAEIQALKDQVAAGGNVTQEQLDTLDSRLQGMRTDVQGAVDRLGNL